MTRKTLAVRPRKEEPTAQPSPPAPSTKGGARSPESERGERATGGGRFGSIADEKAADCGYTLHHMIVIANDRTPSRAVPVCVCVCLCVFPCVVLDERESKYNLRLIVPGGQVVIRSLRR